jgi:ABC-2 type transport system permease protein
MLSIARIGALLDKEAQDLARSRSAFLPALLMLLVLAVPFLIAIGIPRFTGDTMTDDSDIVRALREARRFWPQLETLGAEAAVEAFFFQQFLMMVVLVPVTGAMSLAAHSIVGEKQGRSLEPLLATPVTAAEILVAKVLAAFVPALALEGVALLFYFGGIGLLARPGVLAALLSVRTVLVVLLLGPLSTLVALQTVVIGSSRANDPRTAQQFGTLVVMPIVAVIVAQGVGAFWLTEPAILSVSAVLLIVWLLLLRAGIAIFDRERMVLGGK